MQLIPVLDLMGGRVVHARGGERATYRPLQSTLCPHSGATAVVECLLALHPFKTFYIADLDAIQGRAGHTGLIRAIRRRWPFLRLWVDAGLGDAVALERFLELDLGRAVIGSETLRDTALLSHHVFTDARRAPVLSLDFQDGRLLGPAGLEYDLDRWPARVIVLSLTRVGGGQGPDIKRLRRIRWRAPHTYLYAAGGLRDTADLEALASLDIAGALLASALHDGSIGPAALARHT